MHILRRESQGELCCRVTEENLVDPSSKPLNRQSHLLCGEEGMRGGVG